MEVISFLASWGQKDINVQRVKTPKLFLWMNMSILILRKKLTMKFILMILCFLYALSTSGQILKPFKAANDRFGYQYNIGKVVIKPQFVKAYDFEEGFAFVGTEDTELGYIDKTGYLQFNFMYPFIDGLVKVVRNDKKGCINEGGTPIAPLKYDKVSTFTEGFSMVQLNYKWGFINKNELEVVPLRTSKIN